MPAMDGSMYPCGIYSVKWFLRRGFAWLIRNMEMLWKRWKCVFTWHIPWHDSCGKGSLDDQEYGNVYESAESVYSRGIYSVKWFLRQGFACWSGIWKCLWKRRKCVSTWYIPWNDSSGKGSLDDQEYGNVYESAESVYSRGIYSMKWFLRQGFACWSGIWKCFSESAESVYLRCISHEMILAARVRLLIRDMEMFIKALKVCIHAWHIPWNDSCGEYSLINYKYGDVNERWMSTMRSQAISTGHIKL